MIRTPDRHESLGASSELSCLDALQLECVGNGRPDAWHLLRKVVSHSNVMIYVDENELQISDNNDNDALLNKAAQESISKNISHIIMPYDHYKRKSWEFEASKNELCNFQSLLEFLRDGLLVISKDGNICYSNQEACKLFSRLPEELVGCPFGYPVADKNDTEITLVRHDGQECIVEMRARSIEWNGEQAFLASLRDVTEQKRLHKILEDHATHDGLTGLYNHRTFYNLLDQELQRSKRYNHLLSLLMLDIDHFKMVNDTYGHQAGDAILRSMGILLKDSIREIDMAFRYGGEEFMLIMPETQEKSALEIAERLRKAVEAKPFDIGDGTLLRITLSIGVVCYPGRATSVEELVSTVDAALYVAKVTGRNRVKNYRDMGDETFRSGKISPS